MLSFPASLAGEMAVVLLAVGIKRLAVALEGVDLAVIGQVVQETIDGSDAYLGILLGNLMI